MSGSSPWSVKGIDPKVRERAREEARKSGLTLGEWLNQAILAQHTRVDTDVVENAPSAPSHTAPMVGDRDELAAVMAEVEAEAAMAFDAPQAALPRTAHTAASSSFTTASVPPAPLPSAPGGAPSHLTSDDEERRIAEALDRLNKRLETSERRQSLSVAGIDRTVLGLAAKVEDADLVAREAAARVHQTAEEIHRKAEEVSRRVEDAELVAKSAMTEVSHAASSVAQARAAIDARLAEAQSAVRSTAEDAARATAMEAIETARTEQEKLARRIEENEAAMRAAAEAAVAEARAAQAAAEAKLAEVEASAREAGAAAVDEARRLQGLLAMRLEDAEASQRAAVEAAVAEAREARLNQSDLAQRVASAEAMARQTAQAAVDEVRAAQSTLAERLSLVENGARNAVAATLNEARSSFRMLSDKLTTIETRTQTISDEAQARLIAAQADIARSVAAAEQAAADAARSAFAQIEVQQSQVNERLEGLENKVSAAHANLRTATMGALNQVRTAQAELTQRLEDFQATHSSEVSAATAQLASRLEKIEKDPARQQDRTALQMLDAKLTGLAASVRDTRDRFSADLETLRANGGAPDGRVDALSAEIAQIKTQLDSAPTLDSGALTAVEDRMASSVRGVEDSIARLAERLALAESSANDAIRRLETTVEEKVAASANGEETAAFRSVVENRLDMMAAEVSQMVGAARTELAEKIQTALANQRGEDVEAAVADVNRRLAATERRQAQTIEAISLEIRRMSETLDKRIRAIEMRNDSAATEIVREEIGRLASTLETRITDIEQRDLASAERVGQEIGRLAERFDERFEVAERRSAEAIETVGEQVARMADRFTQKQEALAREVGERIAESEERQASRLGDAISRLHSQFAAVDEKMNAAVNPVQKAMSSVAARLQAVEDESRTSLKALDAPREAAGKNPTDLLNTDPFADDLLAPPPPAEDDPIAGWNEPPPGPAGASMAPTITPFAEEFAPPPPPLQEPELTPLKPKGKESYLEAARNAAKAQSGPGPKGRGKAPPSKKGQAGLKGPSRVVLWSAAGALAVVIAGGAFVMSQGDDSGQATAETDEPTPPSVVETPPPAPIEAPVVDPNTLGTTMDAPPLEPSQSMVLPPPQPGSIAATVQRERASVQPPPPPATQPRAQTQPAVRTAATGVAPMTVTPPQTPPASTVSTQSQPATQPSITLEQAATRGDAVAQYELGLQRIQRNQNDEGLTLLRRAANQGLAMAQYRLAKMYERGEGVAVDLVQARQWTERAAAAGNRKAMHDLGVFFARGEGAPFDEGAAFRWFRQAAELGVADSQFNLGVLYQQGRGVAANPTEALFWFLVAARNGDGDARGRSAQVEAGLSAEQLRQVRARADAFRARPASPRANGEFGPRLWAAAPPAQAKANPRQ